MSNGSGTQCDIGACGWSFDGNMECTPGDGSCVPAKLLSPLRSVERQFHPQELREATEAINEIFKMVRAKRPRGMKLSLLRGPGGMMLAWCEHGHSSPKRGAVTSRSSADKVKQALGLERPAKKA